MTKRTQKPVPTASELPDILTMDHVASYLQCSREVVRRLIVNDLLQAKCITLGKRRYYRIPKKSLMTYLETPDEPLVPTLKPIKEEKNRLQSTRLLRLD